MSVRCRVCHRELRSADAIAAGVGPICAANAAARAIATAHAEARAYPAEKLARIQRAVMRLDGMLAHEEQWTPDAYRLIVHWYGRWRMMQLRAQRFGQSFVAR